MYLRRNWSHLIFDFAYQMHVGVISENINSNSLVIDCFFELFDAQIQNAFADYKILFLYLPLHNSICDPLSQNNDGAKGRGNGKKYWRN